MVLGDAVSTLETWILNQREREVCMDFQPCFNVHTLVSVYPNGMKLGQMTNLNVIFHVVVSVYRLITI